jgi:hypothetical protein
MWLKIPASEYAPCMHNIVTLLVLLVEGKWSKFIFPWLVDADIIMTIDFVQVIEY